MGAVLGSAPASADADLSATAHGHLRCTAYPIAHTDGDAFPQSNAHRDGYSDNCSYVNRYCGADYGDSCLGPASGDQ